MTKVLGCATVVVEYIIRYDVNANKWCYWVGNDPPHDPVLPSGDAFYIPCQSPSTC